MKEPEFDVYIYFKVFGLARDEKGKASYAGLRINLGKCEKQLLYSEIRKSILETPDWKEQILLITHLDTTGIKANDIELITPDEYEQQFGDVEIIENEESADSPKCRVCGCTQYHACPSGYYWAFDNLCSRCVSKLTVHKSKSKIRGRRK